MLLPASSVVTKRGGRRIGPAPALSSGPRARGSRTRPRVGAAWDHLGVTRVSLLELNISLCPLGLKLSVDRAVRAEEVLKAGVPGLRCRVVVVERVLQLDS